MADKPAPPRPQPLTIQALAVVERGRTYAVSEHRRSAHQLYYVLGGNVEAYLDGQRLVLYPDQCLVLAPATLRRFHCFHRAPSYLLIQFLNHSLDLHATTDHIRTVPPALRGVVDTLVSRARTGSAQVKDDDFSHALTTAILCALATTTNSDVSRPALNPAKQDAHIKRLQAWIDSHLGDPIYRSAAARELGVSESTIARLIQERCGCSFAEFLQQRRLQHAKELLYNSQLPISAIAAAVGWNSASHFTKVFKRACGVTPADMRRRQRLGNDS